MPKSMWTQPCSGLLPLLSRTARLAETLFLLAKLMALPSAEPQSNHMTLCLDHCNQVKDPWTMIRKGSHPTISFFYWVGGHHCYMLSEVIKFDSVKQNDK